MVVLEGIPVRLASRLSALRFDDLCARPNRLLGVYPHFIPGGDAAAS
jgi:hypothetical protein